MKTRMTIVTWALAVLTGYSLARAAAPVAVRCNWAPNPIGNLYNKEGLPASCSRTDPASTEQ